MKKNELQLLNPIQHYFSTVNAGAAEEFPSSFAADAIVRDLDREIHGLDAIKEWARHDIFGVQARFEVINVKEREGRVIVTVGIDGTFDKKGLPDPLLMDHAFKVAEGRITELAVTFTPHESEP